MHALQTEERKLDRNTSLSEDIAKHIACRLFQGPVMVVSKQPVALLASTRKKWLKLLRQTERQRASTTNAKRITDYSRQIARMKRSEWLACAPVEAIGADVIFATAKQMLAFAPGCMTMYVATPTDKETLYKITSFMPEGGLVVVYGRLTELKQHRNKDVVG